LRGWRRAWLAVWLVAVSSKPPRHVDHDRGVPKAPKPRCQPVKAGSRRRPARMLGRRNRENCCHNRLRDLAECAKCLRFQRQFTRSFARSFPCPSAISPNALTVR
jgi:hypothetical protein